MKKNYKSIDIDDMYIKAGMNWDVNQSKLSGMDPQLSCDVITNEFR